MLVEMEGAAVAQVAYQEEVPAINRVFWFCG